MPLEYFTSGALPKPTFHCITRPSIDHYGFLSSCLNYSILLHHSHISPIPPSQMFSATLKMLLKAMQIICYTPTGRVVQRARFWVWSHIRTSVRGCTSIDQTRFKSMWEGSDIDNRDTEVLRQFVRHGGQRLAQGEGLEETVVLVLHRKSSLMIQAS